MRWKMVWGFFCFARSNAFENGMGVLLPFGSNLLKVLGAERKYLEIYMRIHANKPIYNQIITGNYAQNL